MTINIVTNVTSIYVSFYRDVIYNIKVMETKEIVVNINDAKITLEKYLLFDYECVEQRQQGNNVYFRFQRNDDVPYIEELRELEATYPNYKIGSLMTISLMPIVTFVLVTIFLVVFLLDRKNFNFTLMFSLLMIPALLVLVLTVILTVVRLKRIRKVDKEKASVDLEYKEKIRKIKEKNNPQTK